jgi:cysteinyl-tRNA synthetase
MDQDLIPYITQNASPEAKADEKFSMHLNALNSARKGILEKNPETYFDNVKDVLLPILDKEVNLPSRASLME